MIRTILGGAAGVIAASAVGGLAYRKARQRRVAKALEITAPNGIVEQRFVKVGGIDQWIQLGGEDRDNPVRWFTTLGQPNVISSSQARQPITAIWSVGAHRRDGNKPQPPDP